VLVSLAGSITALVLLWLPARHLDGSTWMYDKSIWVQNAVHFAAFVNLWWSVANLLPIRPLDGGNVVTELVGVRAARRVSLVAAAAGGVWAFSHDQRFAGLFALLLGFQSYQEIVAERGRA
jgi:Zn-dependent protease